MIRDLMRAERDKRKAVVESVREEREAKAPKIEKTVEATPKEEMDMEKEFMDSLREDGLTFEESYVVEEVPTLEEVLARPKHVIEEPIQVSKNNDKDVEYEYIDEEDFDYLGVSVVTAEASERLAQSTEKHKREREDKIVTNVKGDNLPEGFFDDVEVDAAARGGVGPEEQKRRMLEKEYSLFEHQMEHVSLEKDAIRGAMDAEAHADAKDAEEAEQEFFESNLEKVRKCVADRPSNKMEDEVEEVDDDTSDLEEDVFWRCKKIG